MTLGAGVRAILTNEISVQRQLDNYLQNNMVYQNFYSLLQLPNKVANIFFINTYQVIWKLDKKIYKKKSYTFTERVKRKKNNQICFLYILVGKIWWYLDIVHNFS